MREHRNEDNDWRDNYSRMAYKIVRSRAQRPKPPPVTVEAAGRSITLGDLWHKMHEAFGLAGFQQDEATALTIEVESLIRDGRCWREAQTAEYKLRKQLREKRLKHARNFGISAATIFTVVFGFVQLGTWLSTFNDNDWAGYGPNTVVGHAIDAVSAYYGEDDPQTHILVRGEPKRGTFQGHHAWVMHATADGKALCVHVWGYAGSEVDPGKACAVHS